jgi:hypothetical protein
VFEPAVVVLRWIQMTGAMILFGSSLFLLYALPKTAPGLPAPLRWPRPLLLASAAAVLTACVLDPCDAADQAVIDPQLTRRLDKAIGQLPATLKAALLLTAFEGYSHLEAGRILGVSAKTIERGSIGPGSSWSSVSTRTCGRRRGEAMFLQPIDYFLPGGGRLLA